MIQEIWVPVPGYEGLYEVSNKGRVWSLGRTTVDILGRSRPFPSRMLKGSIMTIGYRSVMLVKDGKQSMAYVHRVVLEAFRGPCPEDFEGCHNNGVRADNRLSNLRWDSRSSNIFDLVAHGSHNNARKTHCPRGHLLEIPNLKAPCSSKPEGGRCCLACARAAARASSRRRSRPAEFDPREADEIYEEIMR